MNYAETLAYWYLRLNGFFPLQRFVLHHDEHQLVPVDRFAADSDLLAIRHPDVSEKTGGQPNSWDATLFNVMGATPEGSTLGLIVEIKGGYSNADPGEAFSKRRVTDAINRMGVLGPQYRKQAAIAALFPQRGPTPPKYVTPDGGVIVAKIVMSTQFGDGQDEPRLLGDYYAISMRHVTGQIRRRINDEHTRKRGDWNFFPSDLFQFLVWDDFDRRQAARQGGARRK